MNLYEISHEIEKVVEMVDEDGVLLPEAEQYLDDLQNSQEQKFIGLAGLIKNLTALSEAIKIEKQLLDQKKKQAENKVERLKKYITLILQMQNKEKYQAGIFTFSFRNGSSLIVDENFISQLPEEFKKITIEPKKTELKEALKQGKKFEGVSIQYGKSIQIK